MTTPQPNQPKREPWEECAEEINMFVGQWLHNTPDDLAVAKSLIRAACIEHADTTNADLRQKLCDLQTHLLFQADALKSPQDVYEVVRRETLEQLRAELAALRTENERLVFELAVARLANKAAETENSQLHERLKGEK